MRVERLSSSTSLNGETSTQQGYLIIVEGLCRVRIDRFIQVGTPFFEAQITAFPRANRTLTD